MLRRSILGAPRPRARSRPTRSASSIAEGGARGCVRPRGSSPSWPSHHSCHHHWRTRSALRPTLAPGGDRRGPFAAIPNRGFFFGSGGGGNDGEDGGAGGKKGGDDEEEKKKKGDEGDGKDEDKEGDKEETPAASLKNSSRFKPPPGSSSASTVLPAPRLGFGDQAPRYPHLMALPISPAPVFPGVLTPITITDAVSSSECTFFMMLGWLIGGGGREPCVTQVTGKKKSATANYQESRATKCVT